MPWYKVTAEYLCQYHFHNEREIAEKVLWALDENQAAAKARAEWRGLLDVVVEETRAPEGER